jgi:hypothetical protein
MNTGLRELLERAVLLAAQAVLRALAPEQIKSVETPGADEPFRRYMARA